MIETMHHLTGAGLAAPQIGQNLRLMIFEITHNPRYPEAEPIPLTVDESRYYSQTNIYFSLND